MIFFFFFNFIFKVAYIGGTGFHAGPLDSFFINSMNLSSCIVQNDVPTVASQLARCRHQVSTIFEIVLVEVEWAIGLACTTINLTQKEL